MRFFTQPRLQGAIPLLFSPKRCLLLILTIFSFCWLQGQVTTNFNNQERVAGNGKFNRNYTAVVHVELPEMNIPSIQRCCSQQVHFRKQENNGQAILAGARHFCKRMDLYEWTATIPAAHCRHRQRSLCITTDRWIEQISQAAFHRIDNNIHVSTTTNIQKARYRSDQRALHL